MARPGRSARDRRRRDHQQNFITDAGLVRRIAADVEPGELVVDVGAGTGALTLAAAAAGARVLAVERDPDWARTLGRRAREAGVADRVRVVRGDLREVSWPEGRWRMIANPPFGLTTALLRRLLDDPERGPDAADLVLQWEVARKFAVQPPGTLLGASWAPWWEMTLVERIPRSAFRPVPTVDAGWLRVRRRRPDVLAPRLAGAWEAFLRDAWPATTAPSATAARPAEGRAPRRRP